MRKVMAVLMVLVLLSGCAGTEETQDRLLRLRQTLSEKESQFVANIHADFGETVYDFTLMCHFDTEGNMTFEVQLPQTISGVTGKVSAAGGALTFDDTSVAFSLLADGELTPVSAPWLMMKGLRGGYLAAWSSQGNRLVLTVDDSYENSPMQFRFVLDNEMSLLSGDILWDGRRILSVTAEDFRYL